MKIYFSLHPTKVAVSVSIIVLLIYLRALSCDFVNWDDFFYVVNNTGIRIIDGQFLVEAFTTSYAGWWMPLTWISFAIDYHFWELNPFGYHLTNILLHSANSGLVVLIADKLLQSQAVKVENQIGRFYPAILLLAGFLWGVHPLRVESVAWVTERKDVLNGLFSLCSILCYLIYIQQKELMTNIRRRRSFYLLSLLFLLLSLMSKPVSVVLPAMLLVADWYPLRRLQRSKIWSVLVEKIPFVILVLLISAVTIYFASEEKILISYSDMSLYDRFNLAGHALFEYVRLTIYPVNVIHLYLFPWPLPVSYTIHTVIIILFSCFCFGNYKKHPWMTATWLVFILPLLPVLGFFQNGSQSHAARFSYLPAIGPSITAAVGIALIYFKIANGHFRYLRIPLVGSVLILILFYGVTTERLIATWDNPETLWSRLISIQPIGRAYSLRADYYLKIGKYAAAVDDLQVAITMAKGAGYPGVFNLHALLGGTLYRLKRFEDAVKELTAAITLNPRENYFYHRGLALEALGRLKEAEDDFARAGEDTGPITEYDPN